MKVNEILNESEGQRKAKVGDKIFLVDLDGKPFDEGQIVKISPASGMMDEVWHADMGEKNDVTIFTHIYKDEPNTNHASDEDHDDEEDFPDDDFEEDTEEENKYHVPQWDSARNGWLASLEDLIPEDFDAYVHMNPRLNKFHYEYHKEWKEERQREQKEKKEKQEIVDRLSKKYPNAIKDISHSLSEGGSYFNWREFIKAAKGKNRYVKSPEELLMIGVAYENLYLQMHQANAMKFKQYLDVMKKNKILEQREKMRKGEFTNWLFELLSKDQHPRDYDDDYQFRQHDF